MNIYSWNVNGIRAVEKKGFINWVELEQPDILCIQETKAEEEQLSEEIKNIKGYTSYFSSSEKKGYSGVAIYTQVEPKSIKKSGIKEFDDEGRYLEAEYDSFILINCYFPNSQSEGARLGYKLDFNKFVEERMDRLVEEGKGVVLCGDLNVAHKEIDLVNPKNNEKNPGYLPEERAWFTGLLEKGYIDTFRHFYPEEIRYSWWSYRFNSRGKDRGWRIDYHIVNKSFISKVEKAEILNRVYGSDHCPVLLKLKV